MRLLALTRLWFLGGFLGRCLVREDIGLFDIIKCKAWRFCNATRGGSEIEEGLNGLRITWERRKEIIYK